MAASAAVIRTGPAAAAAAQRRTAQRGDASSLSNPDDVRVVHNHFELDVDFGRKVVEGHITLFAEAVAKAPKELVLDTRGLDIKSVALLPSDTPLAYELGAPQGALGAPLRIGLPGGVPAGGKLVVGIRYATTPGCTALSFLEPEMTVGKKHPYLFSQCQAIHARSLFPCQDTPAVKSTYTAAMRVPAALTALLSAVPCENGALPALPAAAVAGTGGGGSGAQDLPTALPEGVPGLADLSTSSPAAAAAAAAGDAAAAATRVFYFEQKVAIPSYLVGLAVGELASRDLGPRTRVWAEPGVVDAAAYEFAETPRYVEVAEEIAGPYVWGRYDVLVLPPASAFGGMEHPCMSFLTPTLLAGDRSLTNVVAHELAHSWTGNLVTNAAWRDFWLNEGWTVFLERAVLGRLEGEPARQFAAAQGAAQLKEEIARIGPEHNFTRLVPDLSAGEDPDDAFSRVPYEKGFYFLWHLQSLVGGPARFEPFLRAYLQQFAHSTVTSEQFRDYFTAFFADPKTLPEGADGDKARAALAALDWDTWLHAPGMPPVANTYDTSLAAAAERLAERWATTDVMGLGNMPPPEGSGPDDLKGFSSAQTCAFLERLAELRAMTPLHASTCRQLDDAYKFSGSRNAEVRCAWYKLALAAKDDAVLDGVVDLLRAQGRMKYLRPLYRALVRGGKKDLAERTYAQAKASYHPIAAAMCAKDLGLA